MYGMLFLAVSLFACPSVFVHFSSVDFLPARFSLQPNDELNKSFFFSFTQFYIHSAVKTETKLMKPLLQIVLVSLSLFVGLSRLADNSHFLTDVVAGFILGAIFTWLIVSSFLSI